MRYKTYKLQKLEKTRTESIITNDMEHCFLCGGCYDYEKAPADDIHEIYQGRNRLNSIKYKLILPLCRYHHQELHNNQKKQNALKWYGQMMFEKNYPDLDFLSIFHKNYK